jgi:hypothetical protein
MYCPSGEKTTERTSPLWPVKWPSSCCNCPSQSRARPLLPLVAMRCPSGEKAACASPSVWPVNTTAAPAVPAVGTGEAAQGAGRNSLLAKKTRVPFALPRHHELSLRLADPRSERCRAHAIRRREPGPNLSGPLTIRTCSTSCYVSLRLTRVWVRFPAPSGARRVPTHCGPACSPRYRQVWYYRGSESPLAPRSRMARRRTDRAGPA